MDKKDVLYCKLADAKALFRLDGTLEKNSFVMKTIPEEKKSKLEAREEKVDATKKLEHKNEAKSEAAEVAKIAGQGKADKADKTGKQEKTKQK